MKEFKPLFNKRNSTLFEPTHLTPQYATEQKRVDEAANATAFKSSRTSNPESQHEVDDFGEERPPNDIPIESEADHDDLEVSAPVDMETLLEEAHAKGLEEGRKKAEAEFEDRNQTLEGLQEGIDQLNGLHHQILKDAAQDIGILVTELSQKILYNSLVFHPTALTTLVEEALNAMPENQTVWLSAHPDQLEKIGALLVRGRDIKLQPDPSIEAGFRIFNKHSSIDSTLATIMKGIEAAVIQWRETE